MATLELKHENKLLLLNVFELNLKAKLQLMKKMWQSFSALTFKSSFVSDSSVTVTLLSMPIIPMMITTVIPSAIPIVTASISTIAWTGSISAGSISGATFVGISSLILIKKIENLLKIDSQYFYDGRVGHHCGLCGDRIGHLDCSDGHGNLPNIFHDFFLYKKRWTTSSLRLSGIPSRRISASLAFRWVSLCNSRSWSILSFKASASFWVFIWPGAIILV